MNSPAHHQTTKNVDAMLPAELISELTSFRGAFKDLFGKKRLDMAQLCSSQGAWSCWARSSKEVSALFAALAISADGSEARETAYIPASIPKDKLMTMASLCRNIIGNELVTRRIEGTELPVKVLLAAIAAVNARSMLARSLGESSVPFGFPRWGEPPNGF